MAEKVTWAEVCQQVRMGDTLYSTCREKVPNFGGWPALAQPPAPEPEQDFSSSIEKSAVPIPPPPGGAPQQPLGAAKASEEPDPQRGALAVPPPPQKALQPAARQSAPQGAFGGFSDLMQGELPTKLLWAAAAGLLLMFLFGSKKQDSGSETPDKSA